MSYYDIMLMDLRQCDLVILSACSTHEGEGILGEGIMGLAWAFKAAGAKAVIGTRWPVSDEAAVEFWGGFYRYLCSNVSIRRAFHNARLNLINQKKFNHPFYWGVFQLIV
ncbi:MAG TPA: CHAT domain-containing protein [Candidatus Deferrimicrobium sp.]|nr:CHAT domain-containing protein [Candidatus Deferrimicrobium sp.]